LPVGPVAAPSVFLDEVRERNHKLAEARAQVDETVVPAGMSLSGKFIEFDQSPFLPAPAAHGMSPTGWAYVPASCQQNARCRVHIVLHGCKQYPGFSYAAGPQGKFGDTYVKNAGYNTWADTRATSWFAFWYFARGSNDFLGLGGTQTTLKETSAGSFESVSSCS
jgi:hypothetical protein